MQGLVRLAVTMRFYAEIDDEVAAVLAFVISHTTFLAAQDDETGRCPKVAFKSLEISNP